MLNFRPEDGRKRKDRRLPDAWAKTKNKKGNGRDEQSLLFLVQGHIFARDGGSTMIQDIAPARLDNAFRDAAAEASDTLVSFENGKILAAYDPEAERLRFPCVGECGDAGEAVYLFSVSGRRFFLAEGEVSLRKRDGDMPRPAAAESQPPLSAVVPAASDSQLPRPAEGPAASESRPPRAAEASSSPAPFTRFSLQELRALKLRENTEIFAAYTAYHLWNWYRTSRFCGACGSPTAYDHTERAKVCPACGNRIYPRINPAVIVGVTRGDSLLITRYREGFRHNALVAGFAEIGETLEETVQREVMEEVGLKVRNIRYYKSQPWGIASDLLAGFFCEVDGDDTIRMDPHELKYAEWVPRKEIVLQPSDYSLTNEMMKLFRDGGWPSGEERGTAPDRRDSDQLCSAV